MTYWDSAEPMQPLVPGQADPDPCEQIIEPKCWCGRTVDQGLCWQHGRKTELKPLEDDA